MVTTFKTDAADRIEAHATMLRELEIEFVEFYSQALDIKETTTIQSLLINETYLNDTEALKMGFATEIEPALKAVAMITNNENKEEESLMNKLTTPIIKKMNQVMAMLSGAKAELILQDATAAELVFPDLEASDDAEVGAKVNIGYPCKRGHNGKGSHKGKAGGRYQDCQGQEDIQG
jgi:hypothetical protein